MASTYLQPPSPRRRAIAIGLTIAIHLLLFLLLLNLAPQNVPKPLREALSTFTVAPDGGAEQTPVPKPVEQQRQKERQQAARPAPPRPQQTVPEPQVELPAYLRLTRDQFAATDLARLPRSAARGSDASPDAGNATAQADSSSAIGPGAGPGGARLYNAEWERRPTRAEMAPYMPPVGPGAWADIACRTIPGNRVENCQLLGESPGSKLATAIRRAAWQFRIRPPRIGGKPMVGEWVRIHYVIVGEGEADDDDR